MAEEAEVLMECGEDLGAETKGKFLTFWSDRQLYGIPIAQIVQIIGVPNITILPDSPPIIKGVIDLRGSVVPLIDVRLRFGKPEIPYTERTCIIVTSLSDKLVGYLVDEVMEVTNIAEDCISPPPELTLEDGRGAYLTGLATLACGTVILLAPERLLSGNLLTRTISAAR